MTVRGSLKRFFHPFVALPIAITLALGVALPVEAAPAGASRSVAAPLGVRPCRGAEGVLCGHVRVPLYWSHPRGAKLTVRFHVYEHTDTSLPALEPIVAMEGGPGAPSIGSAPAYLYMIGPLIARHDLIVMDNRGTGSSSVINCPRLQNYFALVAPGDLVAAVEACQRQLGIAANAYGTDAVGDDLAYILSRLGIHRVDVYGDSYGDYSAQVFTLHHPNLVRSLVLDGSYNNGYNPFEMEDTGAMRRAWTLLCDRSPSCRGESMLKEIAAFALKLQAHPLTGVARDSSGQRVDVDLTAPAFAQLVYDATYTYTPFRDLPAALRAFGAGDEAPLMRLAADDVTFNASGSAASDSIGDLEVVSCHDYPTVWRRSASLPERKAELAAAIAKLPADTFYPFTKSVYLASYDENELVYGCLGWRGPKVPDPPFPSGIRYPHTPVLIFDGQFDQATPVFDALKVVRSWPNHTFVEVANANHVTVADDLDHCTSVVFQRFIRTLHAGSTSCARDMPPVSVVPAFPVRLAQAPVPRAAGDGTPSVLGRQAAWVSAETVADALARWFNLTFGGGDGLYGGVFRARGDYDSGGPLVLRLHGCRFVTDLAVSGRAVWNRAKEQLEATVTVTGPDGEAGAFTVRWNTGIYNWRAPAVVTGHFAGRHVDVEMPTPWVAQS